MDWKDKVNGVGRRVKQGTAKLANDAKDKVKAGTTDLVKDQFKSDIANNKTIQNAKLFRDDMNSIRHAKGIGGKAGAVKDIGKRKLRNGWNRIKNSNIADKVREFKKKLKVIFEFIKNNWKIILIVTLILTFGTTIATFVISLAQGFGQSPHYYCDIEPDENSEDSIFYQQYCERIVNSFELENLNGHYIVQDSSGSAPELQKACALNNMLLRFWCMNNVNWYDCIWDNTGNYPLESPLTIRYENGASNIRTFVSGGELVKDSKKSYTYNCNDYTAKGPVGSRNFAASKGYSGYNYGNWGYVRDSSLNFDNTVDAYKSNKSSTEWVWDLSSVVKTDGSYTPYSWYVNDANFTMYVESSYAFRGGIVTIVKNTYSSLEDKQTLIDFLRGDRGFKKHPEGIVVYTDNAAVLITGYDDFEETFICIDSAMGLAGGFEGPINSKNFCKSYTSDWNHWLSYPEEYGNPIKGYYYIEPSFENEGSATMDGADFGWCVDGAPNEDAQLVLIYALQQLGKPYIMGTAGPYSYDCSGLTMMAYKQIGINLVHGATSQHRDTHNLYIFKDQKELLPGDLIFFRDKDDHSVYHHVAIYLGHDMYIHAKGRKWGIVISRLSDNQEYKEYGRPKKYKNASGS